LKKKKKKFELVALTPMRVNLRRWFLRC
jgi:hypothetical protein